MENYILKLNSGTEYKLYKGTTLVSDANLTTLFGTAGEMYLSFDFNSGTPSDLTTLTITDSSDIAVISNSNLTDTIAEGKNYKATWSNSATTFDTFEELEGKALDEAQLSFLMGKIKGAGSNGIKTLTTADYNILNGQGVPYALGLWTLDTGMYAVGEQMTVLTYSGAGMGYAYKGDVYIVSKNDTYGQIALTISQSSNLSAPVITRRTNDGSTVNTIMSLKAVDNLTTNNASQVLSAKQGKVLADRIGDLTTLTTTAKTSAVVAINEVNGKAVGTSETLTIATTDWTALSASDPYDYSATVTATTTISATSTVELINDQAVLFGTYGFAIGSISGQSITLYSIGQPSASVSLTIKVRS